MFVMFVDLISCTRSARDPRDEFHEPRDYVETRDYHEPREGSKKVSRQQQSRDSKDSRRYVDHEENKVNLIINSYTDLLR